MTALVQPHYDASPYPRTQFRPAPLAIPALGFVLGIVAARMGMPDAGGPAIGLIALGLLAAARAARAGSSVRILIVIGLIGAVAGAARYHAARVLPGSDISEALTDDGQLCRIRGLVITPPRARTPEIRNPYVPSRPTPRVDFVLEAHSTVGSERRPLTGLVRVYVDGAACDVGPGDEVEVTGWIARIRGPRNPGEPDWAEIAARSGIRANMSVDSPSLVRTETPADAATRRAANLRAWVRACLLDSLPADSTGASRLLDTLVLGQRSAVERRVDEAFKRVGAVHFLSVSGFHVGVLGGAVYWLMRRVLRRGRRSTAVVTALALVAYGFLAEPNSPIIRAVLVGVLASAAVLLGRTMSFLNWLSFALLAVLAWNPLELFSAGFQLSFLLACALLTVVGIAERSIHRVSVGDVPDDADTWIGLWMRRVVRAFRGLVVVCFGCWLLSAPLVMHHFGMFTPMSALQSILLTPFVMVITLLGFVTLLAGALWPPAGSLLGVPLAALTDWLMVLVDQLSQVPGTVIECVPPPAWLVWTSYGAFALVVLLWTRRPMVRQVVGRGREVRRARAVAIAMSVALVLTWVGWAVLPAARPRGVRLDVLTVGNGSAALLTTRDGRAAVIDCGSMQNIDAGAVMAAAARIEGVRSLELVSVSHANFDHFSGVPRLLSAYSVARFESHPEFSADGRRSVATRRFLDAIDPRVPGRLSAGDELMVGCARLVVLWPPARPGDRWDENDRSVVVRVEHAGRRILVPGDASQVALAEMARLHAAGEIDLRAEVLVAPHHGAVVDASRAFYRAVAPRYVVVSAQRSRRPIEELVRRELGGDVPVYFTGEAGCIRIEIDAGGVAHVSTPFACE